MDSGPKLTERTQDQLINGKLQMPVMSNFPPQQVIPAGPTLPLKIACIGTAPSSRMLAPYNDPTWQIWGCSPGNMSALPRISAWFEIHGTNLLEPENKAYAPQYIDWMSKLTVPLFMQDQQLIKHAISLQKDRMVEEFGPYFFTSTFAWMMAHAILTIEESGHIKGSEIALYGIDMASRDEYIIQRPGAYWFFAEASRRGIKISAPYESDIMQPPPLYGYSDVTPFGRKMRARRDELKERIAGIDAQVSRLQQDAMYLKGALEDNDYGLSIQGGAQDNNDHSYLDRLVAKYQPVPTPSVIQGTITPNSGTNEAPVTVSSPSQGQEQTYGTILDH